MGDLKIEGTHEEQWGAMKSAVIQHHAVIHGNGQPGILDFVVGLRAQFRLVLVLLSIIGVIVSIIAVIEGAKALHGDWSHADPTGTTVARHSPQVSEIPFNPTR